MCVSEIRTLYLKIAAELVFVLPPVHLISHVECGEKTKTQFLLIACPLAKEIGAILMVMNEKMKSGHASQVAIVYFQRNVISKLVITLNVVSTIRCDTLS